MVKVVEGVNIVVLVPWHHVVDNLDEVAWVKRVEQALLHVQAWNSDVHTILVQVLNLVALSLVIALHLFLFNFFIKHILKGARNVSDSSHDIFLYILEFLRINS